MALLDFPIVLSFVHMVQASNNSMRDESKDGEADWAGLADTAHIRIGVGCPNPQ